MKILLGILALIIALGVAAGGYIGVIPGVASLFGSDKPRDLGISVTKEESVAAQTKTGVTLQALPANTPLSQSIVLSGSKAQRYTMTSSEISALANNRPWKYYPLEQVQIRINADGTVETSGILNVDLMMSYVQAIGYTTAEVEKALETYKLPVKKLPFYIKASGEVKNNNVTGTILSASAGRIPIPAAIISESTPQIIALIEDNIAKSPGFSISSLTFGNGTMQFDGTVPEIEATVNK